jgi:hypothetical protein
MKQGKCKCMLHTSTEDVLEDQNTDNSIFKSTLSLHSVTSHLGQFMMFTWTGEKVCMFVLIWYNSWTGWRWCSYPGYLNPVLYYQSILTNHILLSAEKTELFLLLVIFDNDIWRDPNSAGSTTLAVKSRSSRDATLDTGYGLHNFRWERRWRNQRETCIVQHYVTSEFYTTAWTVHILRLPHSYSAKIAQNHTVTGHSTVGRPRSNTIEWSVLGY